MFAAPLSIWVPVLGVFISLTMPRQSDRVTKGRLTLILTINKLLRPSCRQETIRGIKGCFKGMGRPIMKRRASFPETYFSFQTRPQASEPQARVSPTSKLVVMAQYLWPSISDNVSVNVSKLLANSPNWRDVSDPQIQLRIWEFSGVCTHIVTWPRFLVAFVLAVSKAKQV